MMVGDAGKEHFLAIELEAKVGAVLDGAESKLVCHGVYHYPIFFEQRLNGVEMRRVHIPQERVLHGHGRQLHLGVVLVGMIGHAAVCRCHFLSLGITHTCTYINIVFLPIDDLDLHIHLVALGRHIKAMTRNASVVAHTQPYISVYATSGVPAAAIRRACAGIDCHHIFFAIAKGLRDVCLKTGVAILVAGHLRAIHIHIAHIHDALKVEHDAASLQGCWNRKCLSVPPFTHGFETTPLVCMLVPWLLKLVIVREVQGAPCTIFIIGTFCSFWIAKQELPSEIEELALSISISAQWRIGHSTLFELFDILSRCHRGHHEQRKQGKRKL